MASNFDSIKNYIKPGLDHFVKKAYNNLESSLISTKTKLDRMSEISKELCSMLNKEEFSDFTFTVNDKTYFVHKVVLASHSDVFAAMFRSDMKESQTNNAVIDDCDSDVFAVLLHYLYTGDMTKVSPMSEQLLPLSEKYQIKPLKAICENNFEIVNQNAIKALITSEKYLANKLKERVLYYIITNLQDIRSKFTTEFQQFIKDHPDLAYSIFASIDTCTSSIRM